MAPHTGGGQVRPTPNEWDTNGCLSGNRVSGACEGFYASKGPVFDGRQCCYVGCTGPVAPCGRPLIIAGQARVAALAPGQDWTEPDADLSALADRARVLPRALRDELGQAWRQDGRLEHASIAAFANFALELMSLGAPAEFLSKTLSAADDEVRHGRLCFGLANAFDAKEQGPAALDLSDVTPRRGLAEIAAAVVEEACCAETAGALLAARQLQITEDPSVRAALSSIAEDEARHAELGWSFVAWALTQDEPGLHAALDAAFERGIARLHRATHAPASSEASAFGRLGAEASESVVAEAIRQVIEPSRAQLLTPASGKQPAPSARADA